MLWFCLVAAALLVIQYVSCWLYCHNPRVAFLGALVTWFFSTVGFAIRPHMLGYTLLVCELLILHLGRSRDRRWYFLLPPLFAIWVNSHGSFSLGIIVLAAAMTSGFVNANAGLLVSRQFDPPQRKMLLWSSALSIAALFANPVGWTLLAYPLRTIFDRRMQLDAVAEWQKLSFDDSRAFGLLALAGGIVLIVLVRKIEMYLDEVVLLAIAFILAVLHQRLLFAWGIIAAPILCRQLAALAHQSQSVRILPNAILTLASFTVVFLAFPAKTGLVAQVTAGNPVQAVEFIGRTPFGTNPQ